MQTPEEFAVHERETADLRVALLRTQRSLSRSKARVDDLAQAVHHASRDAMLAMGPVAPVLAPKPDKRRSGAEVALWHMSDWQGSKVTPSYNSDVMRQRVLSFCEKARAITEIQRKDHPVRDCVVMFGGDMVEGLFNFPTQPYEIDSDLFTQYATVSRLLVDVVRFALSVYEKVTVVAEWGNHGRIGSKRDAVKRSDNVDRMCYEFARSLLADEKRLTWGPSPEDIQRVEIGDYRALLLHGDEIGRNGFASPMTIVAYITRQQSGAYPWPFTDAYIGHYHSHAEWPLPNGLGAVFQTGSTESQNRYAGVMMAAQSAPSQRLHFVDPTRGRVTAQYKVWLD